MATKQSRENKRVKPGTIQQKSRANITKTPDPKPSPTDLATMARAVQDVSPIEQIGARIRGLMLPDPYQRSTKMLIQGETKYVSWDLSECGFDTVEITQITDVQWGNICCKKARVLEYRDWVLSQPNRFMVWTGDNIDAATMMSKGTTWENVGNPQQQVYEFCEAWAPARHRILGYVGGNHERRAITTFGDIAIMIATLLEIPYSRGKQLIDVHFGKHKPFQISQWHGVGGARTKGTVAQILSRFASEGDSQLYLMGHLHQPMVLPFWKERRGVNGVRAVKTIAALGSSFLETWGSYGEVAGYGPNDVLMPRAVLGKNGDWEVTLKTWLMPLISVGMGLLSLVHHALC